MIRRIPHFIIGGAPRSGTTWLHQLLNSHPEVQMTTPVFPEPKFFLVNELYNRGFEYYLKTWFLNTPKHIIAGEKSTNYLESPHVPGRIYQHLPTVKLIFILRDPVDRAFSNYLWSRMNGLEDKDFETALALEDERDQHVIEKYKYSRPHDYFHRGLYAQHLTPFYKIFPTEQILCVRFEDIHNSPETVYTIICRFLNIASRPQEATQLGTINQTGGPKRKVMSTHTREVLRHRYIKPNRELAALLGPDFLIWRYD